MISHVIFCENVRKEQGNATTYIGAFGPYIKIPQEQGEFAFRQLCIVSLLTFEEHENIEYQLKETISYSLEEVKPIKSIVTLGVDLNVEVTINGEKISLKDLKELLNKD